MTVHAIGAEVSHRNAAVSSRAGGPGSTGRRAGHRRNGGREQFDAILSDPPTADGRKDRAAPVAGPADDAPLSPDLKLRIMGRYWRHLLAMEQRDPWQPRTRALAREMLREDPSRPVDAAFEAQGRAQIAVVIPTKNEAEHIVEAVRNALLLGAEVFVLDSGSTDGTQGLARLAGATVVERRFTNYSEHKNWGLDNLPMSAPWVFILDADERVTPELRRHIHTAVNSPASADGYYINRVLLFMGQTVRHGGLYPSWNLRLFRRGMARYEERAVHEHMVCRGEVRHMAGEMLHIRTEPIATYIAKHVRYADLESGEWVKRITGEGGGEKPAILFRRALAWRQWLKREVWPYVPARPAWRFLHMFVVRLGVLDGRAGWHLALLMASYEHMISVLYREKLARLGEPLGPVAPQRRAVIDQRRGAPPAHAEPARA